MRRALREQTAIAPSRIDRDSGLIEGVRILGPASRNGRTYSPRAMEQAARLYEGAPVNIDHPRGEGKDRPVSDAFGWIRNVRQMPDGVYGDLHYLKSHPQAAVVAEAAERNPNRLGLSHHAEGSVRMDGASVVVESVDKVYSVDLVQTPATNAGLFESEGRHMTIREAAEMAGEEKVLAAEGMGEYADKPMKENEGDYFAAMVAEVMGMDVDRAEKMRRLAAILKAQEMLQSQDAAPAPAAPEGEIEEMAGEEVKKMAESVAQIMGKLDSLVESVGSIKAEHDARKLLESAGRDVTPERLAALIAIPAEKRSTLLESWPASKRGERPAASPPAAAATKYPTDTRQFLAAIRSN